MIKRGRKLQFSFIISPGFYDYLSMKKLTCLKFNLNKQNEKVTSCEKTL